MTDRVAEALSNLDAEARLLGSCLISRQAVRDCLEAGLEEADFHDPQHQQVWAATRAVFEDGGTPDVVTVGEALWQAGHLAGPNEATGYLVGVQAHGVGGSPTRLCWLLRGHAERRAVYGAGTELRDIAVNGRGDVIELGQAAAVGLAELRGSRGLRRRVGVAEAADDALAVIEARHARGQEVTGLRTLPSLDRLTLGFHPGHLIVLGGTPGAGKTTFALQLAAGWAADLATSEGAGTVLYATIEMRAEELAERLLVQQTVDAGCPVGGRKARSGQLADTDWDGLAAAAERVAALRGRLDFYDNPELGLAQLRAEAFRCRMTGGVAAVLVDFTQLMAPLPGLERATREQQVARNVYGLKQLARDFDCPVVALAQLDREITKKGRRPTMGDFRETAAFEHAADVALAMVPPPEDEPGRPVEVAVLKNRAGERGSAWAAADWSHYRFTDGDEPAPAAPERPGYHEF